MNKWLFGIAASAVMLVGCTDSSGTIRALDNAGMKDIEITGYRVFGCDKGDGFSTGFRATNPNGKVVTGVVCSGWLKNSTIRYD